MLAGYLNSLERTTGKVPDIRGWEASMAHVSAQDLRIGTTTVAEISANAGNVNVRGEILSDGSVYWATVNGSTQGQPGKFEPAVAHLVGLLSKNLRGEGQSWGVSVNCGRGGWGVVFGNLAGGGGGGGGLRPCVGNAIGKGPFRRVEDALHAAGRALQRCCG